MTSKISAMDDFAKSKIIEEIKEKIKESNGRINFPFTGNEYYASLIRFVGDPIWKQFVVDEKENDVVVGIKDPLQEDVFSPTKHLTHRYPDRVLFLVTNICTMYCRFCTRSRKVGSKDDRVLDQHIQDAIKYIEGNSEVKDVLLSGGDPLVYPAKKLEPILSRLKEISHVQILRMGSRIPCTKPELIKKELVDVLKDYLTFLNTHFNHPWELTEESRRATDLIIDSGIPVGDQTVLLRGVNDEPGIIRELMYGLAKRRIVPYYIYQCDITEGREHFRTKISESLNAVANLNLHQALIPMPHYVIDAPGGGGKIPLFANYSDDKSNIAEIRDFNISEFENSYRNCDAAVFIDKISPDTLAKFYSSADKFREINPAAVMVVNLDLEKMVEDEDFAERMKKYSPVFVNVQLDHYNEISEEKIDFAKKLVNNGVPVLNLTYLKKGFNDNPEMLKKLYRKLLSSRIKPSYMIINDEKLTELGKEMILSLKGHITGLCVPQLLLDDGTARKIIGPNYVVSQDNEKIILKNYQGNVYEYPEAQY